MQASADGTCASLPLRALLPSPFFLLLSPVPLYTCYCMLVLGCTVRWQVLDEDLRLVLGQQDRMRRGANVWNHPVIYDKLGVNYRRWRNGVEEEECSN